MEEKKTSIIVLLEILKEYSDENHILSIKDINAHMSNLYNISLDRRSMYKNIEMLIDLGYDISTYSENNKGYYLRERDFEKSEVLLLCNAIHASNFIPVKASKELIDKLLKTQSKDTREEFRNSVYIENANKKDNKEFFLNIELLSEAIKEHKVISFDYTKYDKNKRIVKRRDDLYLVSPYYLVYMNERTYLIGKNSSYEDFTHYRVDRIRNLKITTEQAKILAKSDDPYTYAKNKIYMYKGSEIRVALKCDYEILDDMIDRFGKDITVEEYDDKHFITYLNVAEEGIIYLVLQYIEHIEVLEPVSLRNKLKNILKNAYDKY